MSKSTSPQFAEKDKPGPDRELIYLEDDQGYTRTPVKFRTNCPWSVEEIAKLSWKHPYAGRISTGYSDFATFVVKAGYTCELVERLAVDAEPPAGFEIVIGATGNY